MPELTPKQIDRLLKLKNDSELAIFDEIQETKDEVNTLAKELYIVKQSVPNLDKLLDSVRGQAGKDGRDGVDGRDGETGEKGEKGDKGDNFFVSQGKLVMDKDGIYKLSGEDLKLRAKSQLIEIWNKANKN